jgi:cell filamentation protein, protein adenylyltransferase
MRVTGRYLTTSVAGEEVNAFVPFPLPPAKPPLELNPELLESAQFAGEAVRRLDLAAGLVPSIDWFIYGFVRKEAVVTSQIEGTQATLIDVLDYEARAEEDHPSPDVEEVCNYIEALRYGRQELGGSRGLPISMRLLNACHVRLMDGVRGEKKQPGEVRRSQNWVGGSRPGNAVFVPPPPNELCGELGSLEKFIHSSSDLPPLVRIGLIHVQFETIHPYLDGNGRIGRLLIALLLEDWQLLSQPLLYLSLYFKRNLGEYYSRLGRVRTDGDWEGWIAFFLRGVRLVAEEAIESAKELSARAKDDRGLVLGHRRTTLAAVRLFELLPEQPVITVKRAMRMLDTTRPTAAKAVGTLVEAGVLEETSGRQRDRVFAYVKYLRLLGEGTEL